MKTWSILASALSLAVLAGCGTTPDAKAFAMRAGTCNVRYDNKGDDKAGNGWKDRKGDLFALIRKLDMDVFGMQEVHENQCRDIEAGLPEWVIVDDYDVTTAVAYRKSRFDLVKKGVFWLSETPDVPGRKGWGAACPRVCSWMWLKDRRTGKTFCFANTHTDHISALARKEGMLLIIRRMHEFAPTGTPVVFTGDHNCRETEEPAQAVSKHLKNALYISETPPTGPWRTFTGWKWRDREYSTVDALKLQPKVRNARKGSPDADKMKNGGYVWEDCGPRIDYIYVSDGIRVKAYATRGDARPGTKLYPSDHFPVTAVLEL